MVSDAKNCEVTMAMRQILQKRSRKLELATHNFVGITLICIYHTSENDSGIRHNFVKYLKESFQLSFFIDVSPLNTYRMMVLI